MKTTINVNGLSPAETERLGLLTEELGESLQAIGKITRHGYNSARYKNRDKLEKELGDVIAAITRMANAGDVNIDQVIKYGNKKLRKKNQYLHHQPEELLNPIELLKT